EPLRAARLPRPEELTVADPQVGQLGDVAVREGPDGHPLADDALGQPQAQANRLSARRATTPKASASASRCASRAGSDPGASLTAVSIACSAGLKGKRAEITWMA